MRIQRHNTSFSWTVETDETEFQLEVLGIYTPGYEGTYDYPGDDGDFDIVEVLDADGKKFDVDSLDDEQVGAIILKGLEVGFEQSLG